MTHCMHCGAQLESRYLEKEGMIPWCPACQQYRFPVFNTAVSMVVTDPDTGRILLIQQYGKPRWILVAGYVNRGENAENTVIREVKEEVGLTVTGVRFNRSSFFEPSNTLMLNFTAYVSESEAVTITDEVDRYAWFTRQEAAEAILPDSLAQRFLSGWMKDTEAEASHA